MERSVAAGVLDVPGVENLSVVGRGGFATVYRGWQPEFHRAVAVKVVDAGVDPGGSRFSKEIRALGALSGHPNVVPVYGAGTLGERPYLVMPFLDGGTLQDRLYRGALPPAEVVRIGVAIADAVAAAHRVGILHRDIKPANLLFNSYGTPQLADFGVARFADSTRTGDWLAATVGYAAPEALSGDRAGPPADIYSLSATLHAALRGAAPFVAAEGEGPLAFALRVVRETPPDLREAGVSTALAEVLERGMSKEPGRRWSSAEEFRTALEAAGSALAIGAAPPGPIEPTAAVATAPLHPAEDEKAVATGPAAPLAGERGQNVALLRNAAPVRGGASMSRDAPADEPPLERVASHGSGVGESSGRRTPRRGLLGAAVVLVLLLGGGAAAAVLVAGSGGGGSRPATGASRTAAHSHRSGAATQVLPPSKPTANPSTAATSPPSSEAAAPATPDGPPSAGGVASAVDLSAAVITSTVKDYYSLVNSHDLNEAFQWLSPAYQQRTGEAYYHQFWDGISSVTVLGVTPGSGQAAVAVRYVKVDGTVSNETDDLGFIVSDGHILINTYAVG